MSLVDAIGADNLFESIDIDVSGSAIEVRHAMRQARLEVLKARVLITYDNVFDYITPDALNTIDAMKPEELVRVQTVVSHSMAAASHALGVALYAGEAGTLATVRRTDEHTELMLSTPFMDVDKPAVSGRRVKSRMGFEALALLDRSKGLKSPKHTAILDVGIETLHRETQ